MRKEYDDKVVFSTPQQTFTVYKDKVHSLHGGSRSYHKIEYRHLKKNFGRNWYIWDKHYQEVIDSKNLRDAKFAARHMHNLTRSNDLGHFKLDTD